MKLGSAQKKEFYLKIKVLPSVSKTEFRDILEDGTIKVGVAAAPEKGKANLALIKFLCKEFGLKKDKAFILSGAEQRTKLIKFLLD